MRAQLNLYGISIHLSGMPASVNFDLRHDFSYFLQEEESLADLTITLEPAEHRFLHWWVPYFYFRKSTLYLSPPKERRVCFLKSAWVQYAPEKGWAKVFVSDPLIAYETVYSLILSFVGESLSLQGLQRIHGLGIKVGDEGALCLAPSGGGKSTLLLSLLKLPQLEVLSDDTPLVDLFGRIHPFPQRISLKERPHEVPEKFLRHFKRTLHQEKYVVGSEYFWSRIAKEALSRRLILLRKHSGDPKWTEVGKWKLWIPLVRWLVLGHETPQIWEFFVRFSLKDFLRKITILRNRWKTLRVLLKESRAYVFTLSENSEKNASFLTGHLLSPL